MKKQDTNYKLTEIIQYKDDVILGFLKNFSKEIIFNYISQLSIK